MNLKRFILSLILLVGIAGNILAQTTANTVAISTSTTSAVEQSGDYISHTVAKGETVYSISILYKTTPEEIYRINPTAKDNLQIGQKLLVTQAKNNIASYTDYTIEAKETLYGVSLKHGTTVKEIQAANPGLDESNFHIGKKIKVPVFERNTNLESRKVYVNQDTHREHKVQEKETLYSLSRTWNVSIEELKKINPSLKDGLKKGQIIYIPRQWQYDNSASKTNSEYLLPKDNIVRVGVLLPFLEDGENIEKEKISEYCNGILIAIKELKGKGLNAEIDVFDIGSHIAIDRLGDILKTTEANNWNLIIGGISQQQIDVLSDFSKRKAIKYIVPFGVVDKQLADNSNMFQATNSHTALYWDIASAFKNHYKVDNYNIIFLSSTEKDKNNKEDFIEVLKKTLVRSQISFQNLTITGDLEKSIGTHLVQGKTNVLVPSSSSEATLRTLMPIINAAARTANVSLFGYPEWQMYTTSYGNTFHKFDTQIYSIFDFDAKKDAVNTFEEEYRTYFGKQTLASYPKYAYLGYDTGLYFLTAIKRYGLNFESRVQDMILPTLQSAIHYKRIDDRGGYINNGLYFIHYKRDNTKENIDCNRQW